MHFQMYQVSFHVHYEDLIDVGKVIVCAADQGHAVDIVRAAFELPVSTAVFDVQRIKGNLFQQTRDAIQKSKVTQERRAEGAREYQQETGPSTGGVFDLTVASTIRAASEAHAWRKLSKALVERASANRAIIDPTLIELDMAAERKKDKPRSAAIEKQAIYTEPRFFSGGAARGH